MLVMQNNAVSVRAPKLLDQLRNALRTKYLRGFVPAKRPQHLPTVLSRREVALVLGLLKGPFRLMAGLLYGSRRRRLECLQLRVKDLDLERAEVLVRRGKGGKDRVSTLPRQLTNDLELHLRSVKTQHDRDLLRNAGWVELPGAPNRMFPNAGR